MKLKHSTGFIYTLNCPDTGLVRYIGQTVNLEKRYSLHLYWSKRGKCDTYKEKWINKLLAENKKPVLDIIGEYSIALLDQKEIEFIALFKSFGSRLTNSTFGGKTTRGRKCSEETKERFRQMFVGKCLRPPITEKEKIDTGNRKRGVPLSEEQKAKMRLSIIGRPSHWKGKKMHPVVAEMRRNSGKDKSKGVIAYKHGIQYYFASQIEAKRITGCDRKSIRDVCNGTYKQANGYFFMHA